ncbi:MAG TPA: TadE family protein [Candidatus Ozemobacteraceae bacterium]
MIKRGKNGQALVEMALVMPLLILVLLCGVVDFGFVLYRYISLQQLANEATSSAAEWQYRPGVAITGPMIEAWLTNTASHTLPACWTISEVQKIRATVKTVDTSDKQAKILVVGLVYDAPLYTPFFQAMFKKIAGKPGITLATKVAYQIPQNILRENGS